MSNPEIVVVDRASTPDEAAFLQETYEESLKSLGRTSQFEMLEPQFHNAGRNSHWEIRMLNLTVRAERLRAEEAAEAEARKVRAAQWRAQQEERRRQEEIQRLERERKRAENEPIKRKKISAANKGRPRPQGAGRKATLYRAFGESRSLREWALESGIPEPTLRQRISRGLSMPEALTRPMHQR
ncbi:hypothetical protein [Streptomyces tubercidicus]|uniref:hypothetical protein n=1 Tax=Streptomyces tubercidicus TaxID=47759 RepID=UPI0036D10808